MFFDTARVAAIRAAEMPTPTTTAQPSASTQLTLGSCSPGGSWPVIFFQPT